MIFSKNLQLVWELLALKKKNKVFVNKKRIMIAREIFLFENISFAFSKRKLCKGENFQIKDFDEFRSF